MKKDSKESFYWPTLFRDVAHLSWMSEVAGESGTNDTITINGDTLWVMDIVGPLPHSRAGHKISMPVNTPMPYR